jgi:hypothetical protein
MIFQADVVSALFLAILCALAKHFRFNDCFLGRARIQRDKFHLTGSAKKPNPHGVNAGFDATRRS